MKKLNFALAAALLAVTSTPLVAQALNMPASYEFLKAVRDRDGNKVTDMLSSGPSNLVNVRDEQGETALTITIARSDSDWTGFLLNKGADPNLSGKGGDTPLIAAARVGFEDAIDWLLSVGAKVDGTNKMGETPLIVAVQQREAKIVRLLLDKGANPDKTDNAAGLSARDYAARDTRSRQILQMIEAKKPNASAAAH
ncbi:MAG: ankyrin repeat domain-containing protein [Sphingomicrobium sp.]